MAVQAGWGTTPGVTMHADYSASGDFWNSPVLGQNDHAKRALRCLRETQWWVIHIG